MLRCGALLPACTVMRDEGRHRRCPVFAGTAMGEDGFGKLKESSEDVLHLLLLESLIVGHREVANLQAA